MIAAAAGGFALGCAAYLLEHAWHTTGMARKLVGKVTERSLTATAPARLERYQWIVQAIPDDEYYGGERVAARPELVLSYDAADGQTRWLRVRGAPNNTDTIQTYMAHFAGIFGLPWIDYVLPEAVVRRLSYDPGRQTGWANQPPNSLAEADRARFGDTYDTWLVASSTDRAVEQLALMWAAPSPPLSIRYDPRKPERAWPAPLLAAFSRPLSRDVATWIEAVVFGAVGAAVLWRLLAYAFRPRRVVLALWLAALASVPLWTPYLAYAADLLGVSRSFTAVFGRGLINPVKLHRIEVEPMRQPEPSRAVRWALGPEEGATLLARLAPPPPPRLGWSDLLARDENGQLEVAERFAAAARSALLTLPDDELSRLLDGLCEPSRVHGLIDKLRPAMERLAADPGRTSAVRERAGALSSRRAICR